MGVPAASKLAAGTVPVTPSLIETLSRWSATGDPVEL